MFQFQQQLHKQAISHRCFYGKVIPQVGALLHDVLVVAQTPHSSAEGLYERLHSFAWRRSTSATSFQTGLWQLTNCQDCIQSLTFFFFFLCQSFCVCKLFVLQRLKLRATRVETWERPRSSSPYSIWFRLSNSKWKKAVRYSRQLKEKDSIIGLLRPVFCHDRKRVESGSCPQIRFLQRPRVHQPLTGHCLSS